MLQQIPVGDARPGDVLVTTIPGFEANETITGVVPGPVGVLLQFAEPDDLTIARDDLAGGSLHLLPDVRLVVDRPVPADIGMSVLIKILGDLDPRLQDVDAVAIAGLVQLAVRCALDEAGVLSPVG